MATLDWNGNILPPPSRHKARMALEDVFAVLPAGEAARAVSDALRAAYGDEVGRVIGECVG